MLGILVSASVYPSIFAAYRAISKIQGDNHENEFLELKVPRLTGGGASKNLTLGALTPFVIPIIIILIWGWIFPEIIPCQRAMILFIGIIITALLSCIILWVITV